MDLRAAKEFIEVPPDGLYKVVITKSEVKPSAKGKSMISIAGEIRDHDLFGGTAFFDNLLTNSNDKGSGIAKGKLRGMGFPVEELVCTDEELAGALLGLEVYVQFGHEQGRDKQGNLKTQVDPSTGQVRPLMNLRPLAYFTSPVSSTQPTAPAVTVTSPAPAATVTAPTAPAAPVAPAVATSQPAAAGAGFAAPPWEQKTNGANGTAQPAAAVTATPIKRNLRKTA